MNTLKKVLVPVLLIVALLVATLPAFAAESPETKIIANATVTEMTYNGKVKTPKVKVYDTDGKKVSSKYYTVEVDGTPKDAGKYALTITGKGNYTGTVKATLVIHKARNPFTLKAGKTSFTYNKKKTQTTTIKIVGRKESAKMNPWTTTKAKVYVKSGKIYVKKGFKGTAIISIKSRATKNYKPTTKTLKITVK